MVAVALPCADQPLESAEKFDAFEFGPEREDVVFAGNCRGELHDSVDGLLRRIAWFEREDFIEGGQGRRNLRAGDDFPVDDRDEWVVTTAVAGVSKAKALGEAQGVPVHAPAGGAVRRWLLGE